VDASFIGKEYMGFFLVSSLIATSDIALIKSNARVGSQIAIATAALVEGS
jgi:hypothetical protein